MQDIDNDRVKLRADVAERFGPKLSERAERFIELYQKRKLDPNGVGTDVFVTLEWAGFDAVLAYLGAAPVKRAVVPLEGDPVAHARTWLTELPDLVGGDIDEQLVDQAERIIVALLGVVAVLQAKTEPVAPRTPRTPAVDGQEPKRRGRPLGSKNKPRVKTIEEMAAKITPENQHAVVGDEVEVDEPITDAEADTVDVPDIGGIPPTTTIPMGVAEWDDL